MKYQVEELFIQICKEILSENKTLEEWKEIESDDMFQNSKYVGGFDAIEMEFCFGMYENKSEYWFQVSLEDVVNIVNGKKSTIDVRPAEK